MQETITLSWRPHSKTSDTLKSEKYGYSPEQLMRLGEIFVKRFNGQELSSASSEFFNFVKSSERGQNIKAKPDNALQEIEEKRSHKADDSAERAQEAKKALSPADAGMLQDKKNLIMKRWPNTDWKETFNRWER